MPDDEKTVEEQGQIRVQAYWEMVHSRAGAIVLEDLMAQFSGCPFDATNQYVTAFNCGRMWIIGEMLHLAEEFETQHPRPETAL